MQYRINERPKYKLNFYSPEEIFFLNLKHKVAFSSWNDNFNSMIVRLKDGNRRGKRRIEEAFQFYDSPIKSNTCYQRRRFLQRFQFYDSPIKSTGVTSLPDNLTGFNSMIVRLKAWSKKNFCPSCPTFQFYDSPIKRFIRTFILSNVRLFQFYDSPIKRTLNLILKEAGLAFQFYDSPIKRKEKRFLKKATFNISILW